MKKRFFDAECNRTYLSYRAFRSHNHMSHTDDPMPCRICETILKSREVMKQHYIRKHGIQDRELLKELTGAGYAKRGKTTLKCPLETCPTCGQNYSKNYFYRHHRDRCAEGSISTNRPLYPGFAALIPPAEILAKYSVTQPTPVNTEQIKKREETLKKWREIEEEQRRDQLVNPGKYPKERTPKGNSEIKYGKKDREKKTVGM